MTAREHRDDLAFEVDDDMDGCEVSEAALAQPFKLGALLRSHDAGELARRDGQWDAFSAQVFKEIDRRELATARLTLEDRAVEHLKRSVESEVAHMTPRFERNFGADVEARIWRAAKQPSLGEQLARLWGQFKESLAPRRLGYAATAAALAAGLFWMQSAPSALDAGTGIARTSDGHVRVDSVTFQGTVTVMSEDDMTLVWLDDATS